MSSAAACDGVPPGGQTWATFLDNHRHLLKDTVIWNVEQGRALRPDGRIDHLWIRVADVAAQVEPFSYRLARVATFPNGIVHLVPEPDGGFTVQERVRFRVD